MAFFLESTFIALWWFGKDRLPAWVRLGSIWLVAIGTQISIFWIVLANAWMHHPVGYDIVNGQAVLTSFTAVMFNYKAVLFALHVQGSAWMVAGFFVCAISAYHLLRRQDVAVFSPVPADRADLRCRRVAVLRVQRARRRPGRRPRPADEVRRDGGPVGDLGLPPRPGRRSR